MRPAEFDKLASGYYERELLLGDAIGPWLEEMLSSQENTHDHANAVDLTCGAGRHTKIIADHYQKVAGYDLSSEMVEIARNHNGGADITYEARDLFTVTGEYDLVFSSAAFHDLPDLDLGLEKAKSLLAPRGVLIFADVVAKHRAKPWLYYRLAPLYWLLVDLTRRSPRIAWKVYRLCTEKDWVRHLANDRYLNREEFESRCLAYFPDASFYDVRNLKVCVWRRPQ